MKSSYNAFNRLQNDNKFYWVIPLFCGVNRIYYNHLDLYKSF